MYSRIRAIGDLLIALYPYSLRDLTYNDRKAIQGIQNIRRLLDQAFCLYARPIYVQQNILALFLLNQQIVFSLELLEEWKERSDSVVRSIFFGLVNVRDEINDASFNRMSQLADFISKLDLDLSIYA